ncbi:hypothetical protein [Syntrophomonas wolfei]|uniref:hypothetical protein n=1 Tax=Syntrophomonas wolfei TaxID=863 RepID=UPI0023F11079|nr:hypothetical protein [Syntrophomonas wolfei]
MINTVLSVQQRRQQAINPALQYIAIQLRQKKNRFFILYYMDIKMRFELWFFMHSPYSIMGMVMLIELPLSSFI